MKRWMQGVAVAAVGCLFASSAVAKSETLACQNTKASGFKFENGQWQYKRFAPDQPFFLRLEDGVLDATSVSMGFSELEVFCHQRYGYLVHCDDGAGTTLFLNLDGLEGAFSAAASVGTKDPTLADAFISLFVCQKM